MGRTLMGENVLSIDRRQAMGPSGMQIPERSVSFDLTEFPNSGVDCTFELVLKAV